MQLSIMGCGWLGQPLAQQLLQDGHDVVATCRSEDKKNQLEQLGLNTHIFNLGDSLRSKEMLDVLQTDVLILNIPPGGKHIQADFFTQQMCALVKEAKSLGTKRLLFISTTAVYGEVQGEITERSPCQPTTLSAQAHLKIEHRIKETFGDDASILRLAGLVGQQRHPASYLAAKVDLQNALQKVNLVHQHDVIAAIKQIIQLDHFGHVLHLSAHDHPTREAYYRWACAQLNLTLPRFIHTADDKTGKQINAQWTCEQLELQLKYPSPYDM